MSSVASSRIETDRWVELPAAMVLIAISLTVVGLELRAIPFVYLAAVTPALCTMDVRRRRLPNRLVLPGYVAAAAGIAGEWTATGAVPIVSLVAGLTYFAFMLAFSIAGGMGMGDVKLAGVLGLAAGLLGATTAVLSPMGAFLLGGIAAIAAIRRGSGSSIPFGPFMLAGLWIAVVVTG